MSIDVQTLIRNTCLYRGGEFQVLMAMADSANTGDGRGIFPGIGLLAANARQSVRQCQENIERLRADHVVIQVDKAGEDMPPDEAPLGGRGRKTEYRIDLERVQELQGLHEAADGVCDFCKARQEQARKRAQFAARKGAVFSKKDAVSDTKGEVSRSHIETNPIEPKEPSQPPHARAREGEGGSDSAGKKKRRYSDPFERIWTEILKWPGLNRDLVSKPEVFSAFQEVEAELPPTGDAVAAARAYGQGLARENTRRAPNDLRRPVHPANWFRKQHWAREVEPDGTPDEPVRPTTISGEHVARLRVAGLEDPVIAQWFGDGEFDDGPPPIFRAASQFKGDWIAQRFAAQLERAFGARVLVTVKQERAA